ncbi:hypothetical protein [Seonamhaeicola sp.]|uniref:hypothetical protein n=1 Tax=Seonamhaeicola sp. TaxID=1912245 RepID=UPI00260359C7|nr:hypothetical protein [Seonamhaeicola sp.]
MRPWVLEKDLPNVFKIFVLSVPNLAEAIIGTLLLTGLLFQLRPYFNQRLRALKDTYIHLAAVGIAGVYGISQEYKWHNIGGNNVFDIYDVMASIIGLVIAFGLLQKFGFIDKTELYKE